ncbi:MAG: GDP-mannose 4,6-dehydratase [Pirellulales bacterium]|nr:GDP-mannose 4,6-dehydratase [Pirellulales bacterium]
MKHCLVTGGAGFIGSHLAEALLARGDRVSVIDNESTGSIDNLAAVLDHPNFDYTKGSVDDADLVRQALAEVDEVYHLAAAVGVELIARAPIHTIETNVYPTELILRELSRQHEAGHSVRLFLASTSEVYGKNPKPRWDEDDDLVFGPTTRARWSYGASKAIDEFLALAYWRQSRLPVVIARFFNVVGPRQSAAYGMVLPRFVEAALAGRKLVVHDDGQQTRCFAHVADVVRVVLRLMETPAALGRVFNVGSDAPVRILDLARRVIDLVDPSLGVEMVPYAEAYSSDFEDCRHRVPNLDRLRLVLDERPQFDLDATIRDVIAWKRAEARRRIVAPPRPAETTPSTRTRAHPAKS